MPSFPSPHGSSRRVRLRQGGPVHRVRHGQFLTNCCAMVLAAVTMTDSGFTQLYCKDHCPVPNGRSRTHVRLWHESFGAGTVQRSRCLHGMEGADLLRMLCGNYAVLTLKDGVAMDVLPMMKMDVPPKASPGKAERLTGRKHSEHSNQCRTCPKQYLSMGPAPSRRFPTLHHLRWGLFR
jgi:hypothetical protein